MTAFVLAVTVWLLAGCASSLPRASATLLVRADRLVSEEQYAAALNTYDEILAKYPGTKEAGRARTSRDTLGDVLAARTQIARLTAVMKTQQAELARARQQLIAREGDLVHARQEIARLVAETERLRTDLEQLKKIDIDLERRRR